mgnify:FL=1|jgi:hypothetical protein|tara:strand:- start:6617 stop:6913 length:297 start_codon:yes stop_codon:yes gene_type:complete
MLNFDVSKLLIIVGFLGLLILVQIIVKKTTIFSKLFTPTSPTLLKVVNKVSVSNYSTASVLQCEDRSFLIVSGKNTQPTVVELSPNTSSAGLEQANDI